MAKISGFPAGNTEVWEVLYVDTTRLIPPIATTLATTTICLVVNHVTNDQTTIFKPSLRLLIAKPTFYHKFDVFTIKTPPCPLEPLLPYLLLFPSPDQPNLIFADENASDYLENYDSECELLYGVPPAHYAIRFANYCNSDLKEFVNPTKARSAESTIKSTRCAVPRILRTRHSLASLPLSTPRDHPRQILRRKNSLSDSTL